MIVAVIEVRGVFMRMLRSCKHRESWRGMDVPMSRILTDDGMFRVVGMIAAWTVLMVVIVTTAMMVVVAAMMMIVIVMVARGGLGLADRQPDSDAADGGEHEQADAAEQDRQTQLGAEVVEAVPVPEQAHHEPNGTANADRAELVEVIAFAVRMIVIVRHEPSPIAQSA
jgi:hypothetical protein